MIILASGIRIIWGITNCEQRMVAYEIGEDRRVLIAVYT